MLAQIFERDVTQEHVERVADLADLAAVAADVVEDVLLEIGIGGAAEIDVDEPELADAAEEPRPRVDRLVDIAGERQAEVGKDRRLKFRHGKLLVQWRA